MDLSPLYIRGQCVMSDEELFQNIDDALTRGLPVVARPEEPRPGEIAIVASGPSIKTQLDTLWEMRTRGVPIVAVRDAHNFLIDNDLVPDYAVSVDPLASASACFHKPHQDVHYMIGSQSSPVMFNQLIGNKVTLWHLLMKHGQNRPNGFLIGGAQTSGLRAISLFYMLGWRHFALFGFDCCMDGKALRINGEGLRPGDEAVPVQLEPAGEIFWCNRAMALQAQEFQNYYDWMPDAQFDGYGHGLIPAIIQKRAKQLEHVLSLSIVPLAVGSVSFIHAGGPSMASYRYRAEIPAKVLGASINDMTASTLIFAKPHAGELMQIWEAKARGQRIIVDFCDDHFEWSHYRDALRMADQVTCPTQVMADRIRPFEREATIIPDPYEFPQMPPHCSGKRLLWFGHEVNKHSLERIMPDIAGYPLRVVSNFGGSIPWSKAHMHWEFGQADIVILPATENYKSANRAVEAIRQGCFVVAEPHPAWNPIPGIWTGNIKEGIQWAVTHLSEANQRSLVAQKYVTERYSPKIVADAWKTITTWPTTSEVDAAAGLVGSTST